MKHWKRVRLVSCGILVVYIVAYVALSRRGYAEAEQFHLKGFYYFPPEDSDSWRIQNGACVRLFWPLNVVDRALGTGRHPAYEPTWRLVGSDAK